MLTTFLLVIAQLSPEATTAKDALYLVAGIGWCVYLPLEIYKIVRGKDKVTKEELDKFKAQLAQEQSAARASLAEQLKSLQDSLEKADHERHRNQQGIDRDLGRFSEAILNLTSTSKSIQASLVEMRREFDAKIGTFHRRLDAAK